MQELLQRLQSNERAVYLASLRGTTKAICTWPVIGRGASLAPETWGCIAGNPTHTHDCRTCLERVNDSMIE